MRFANHCILFLFTFYKVSQLFWNWVCMFEILFNMTVLLTEEVKLLVEKLRELLAGAGFQLHQCACNVPSVLSHLPQEAQSKSLRL